MTETARTATCTRRTVTETIDEGGQVKIIEYQFVQATTCNGIEEAVNVAIQQGWQPFGGLSVVRMPEGDWWYHQAMVKYAEGK